MAMHTRWYLEGQQEGRQEGRQEGTVKTLERQIRRRFGSVSAGVTDRLHTLTQVQLEDLTDAILDFTSVEDLEKWLAGH